MPEDDFAPLRVAAAERIADAIVRFDLVHPAGAPLAPFTAGAHLKVRAPNGLVRRYSLCSDPAERAAYSIAVKREADGAGGSVAICDGVAAGDLLPCTAPRNDFALAGRPAAHLLIAGGIGITPIMAMIHELETAGGPPWRLVYLTRSPAQTAFRETLAGFGAKVTIHHDGGDPARAFDLWPLLEQPKGRQVHCCGPRGLMESVRDMTGHWPAGSVLFEDFGAADTAARAEDHAFTVRLARSGESIAVPAGTSILEAIRATGRHMPSSCEAGSCGTCRTGLLGGAVDHRDLVLMGHERERAIMVCVSRAAPGEAELVLDL